MGKIYYSPYAGYEYRVRPRRDIYQDGVVVDTIRELTAEFATHRPEYAYDDSDGMRQMASDISGHYFDLDAQAEQKGWTPDETALAETRLDRACEQVPGEIRLHTRPPAVRPWPKYDTAQWKQIADLAEQFGCVDEAIAYEQETKNRPGVLDMLAAKKDIPTFDTASEKQLEELTAA